MNCQASFRKPHRNDPVDPEKVELLNEIVRRTGCKIVVSSTWRRDENFKSKLRRRGGKVAYHRDWRTGHICDSEPRLRGREIAEWLSAHPEVTTYAIVDDGSDMLFEQKRFFVRTDYAYGMKRQHADRLIKILGEGE